MTFTHGYLDEHKQFVITDGFAEAIKAICKTQFITHEEVNKFARSDEYIAFQKEKIEKKDDWQLVTVEINNDKNMIKCANCKKDFPISSQSSGLLECSHCKALYMPHEEMRRKEYMCFEAHLKMRKP